MLDESGAVNRSVNGIRILGIPHFPTGYHREDVHQPQQYQHETGNQPEKKNDLE
jgi:hypothetical protein